MLSDPGARYFRIFKNFGEVGQRFLAFLIRPVILQPVILIRSFISFFSSLYICWIVTLVARDCMNCNDVAVVL